MGYSPKITEKHKQRILSKQTKNEQVRESFKVAKEVTTDNIGNQIASDMEKIRNSIEGLDKWSKDYPDQKNKLMGLLQSVAYKYAIRKQEVIDIQEEINKILGVNKSAI